MATANAAVVTSIYGAIAPGQTPPAADLAVYTAQLNSGALTTAQVASLIESSTFVSTVVNPIIREYQAAFGRVPDQAGLKYWIGIAAPNGASGALNTSFLANIATTFSNSAEFQSRYGTTFSASTVITPANGDALLNALYTNILGRAPDAAGKAYWLNAGATVAQVLTSFSVAPEFVSLTNGPITTFQNAEVAGNAPTSGSLLAGSTAVTTNFSLTTTVDTLTGTTGNDTFIGDNTNTSAPQYTIADTITGNGGVDTLKVYLYSVAASANAGVDGQNFGTLNGVSNVYINGGTLTAGATKDFSGLSGVTNIELDSPLEAAAVAQTFTITTGAGQTLQLDKVNTGGGAVNDVINLKGGGTAQTVNLNGVTTSSGVVGTVTLNEATAAVTSLTLNSVTAASTVNITGAGLNTLVLTGSQNLTVADALGAQITKIDASGMSGKAAVDVSGAAIAAGFTFLGGAANDTLTVAAGTLAVLTAGSQIDLGGGTGDTLILKDAALVASDYTKLNTVKNTEILGLGGTATTTIDASQITATFANHFALSSAQQFTIQNMAAASIVDISVGALASTFAPSVGVSSITINDTFGGTLAGLTTTGFTTVNLSSGGTSTAVHNVTLVNSDNTNIVITGAQPLTLAVSAGTATGDKIDGSAATGILNITGSTKGDIILGGSAADTIITLAGASSTLTGGAGADTFNVSATVNGGAGLTNYDTITDFAVKSDILKVAGSGAPTFTSAAVNVSAAASLAAAANIAVTALGAGTATNGTVDWFQYGGATYIVENNGTTHGTISATDLVVKLTGLLDLSTLTASGVGILS